MPFCVEVRTYLPAHSMQRRKESGARDLGHCKVEGRTANRTSWQAGGETLAQKYGTELPANSSSPLGYLE